MCTNFNPAKAGISAFCIHILSRALLARISFNSLCAIYYARVYCNISLFLFIFRNCFVIDTFLIRQYIVVEGVSERRSGGDFSADMSSSCVLTAANQEDLWFANFNAVIATAFVIITFR